MKFIAYGLNHTTAPIEVREKYALPPEQIAVVLGLLKPFTQEAVFLSTCNRVEFYLATEKPEDCLEEIHKALSPFHPLKSGEVKKYFYLHEGVDAFSHLFRVASSLDSMVLGEAQILGQVKDAYQEARAAGMTGGHLNGVFSRAFSAAKKVRTQTEISRMPTNVSSVSVDLARKIFSNLADHSVLLLGAGEMIELTAKYLRDSGVKELFIANRTLEKAKTLAHRLGGTALSIPEGLKKLAEVDILMTSVSSRSHLLGAPEVEAAMKHRGGRALFVIDLGVPRNVDPKVGEIGSVYLYNIDDLSSIVQVNREGRKKAVESAESILKDEVDQLCHRMNSLELVPTVVRLRERFEAIRKAELEKFTRKNQGLSEKDRQAADRLTKDIIGKLLHEPSANLMELREEGDRFDYARMLTELFDLEEKKNHE